MNGKIEIPYLDLKQQYKSIQKKLEEKVLEELRKTDYILGESVSKFENEFCNFIGSDFCISVDSGTSALFLSLLTAGISKGDEVITVANTFMSTVSTIMSVGAIPILVDCDEFFLIDVNQIEKAITKKTRAIMPVHLYGQMANMKKILKIAKKYNLIVIEDAAQAHGASQNGQKAGNLGDFGCFSFYPSKNLGACGSGGVITTSNSVFRNRLKTLRNYGSDEKYKYEVLGYNHRFDSVQAAILSVKLKYLSRWNMKRRKLAKIYDAELASIKEVKIPKNYKNNEHIYHVYGILVRKRNELQKYLLQNGIMTLVHYPVPIHLQKACKFLGYKKGDFPMTEKFAENELSLPLYPEIKIIDIKYVCNKIREFYEK